MDIRSEIKDFLTARRARISPAEAGLPTYGARRVPGLRREEVAVLAGVSVPYYKRLERGQAGGVSDSVLNALARALQLDKTERSHLFALMRAAAGPASRPRPRVHSVGPELQSVLDSITAAPAFVRTRHLDVIGANTLARALFFPAFSGTAGPVNSARFIFLDPRSRTFYGDWDEMANEAVAALHLATAQDPGDPGLSDLVEEFSLLSEDFRTRWSRQDVRRPGRGTKVLRHPEVGAIELAFEPLDVICDDGVTLFTCTPPPGTSAARALRQLGDWAGTKDLEYPPRATARLVTA
ncbi:helix-turn-helix transcriptional regulator [Amycolatopsis sp. NBC_01480]|uniref:helix-turn-helix transcriptional regulator n=1 Tax=Amycolatopsis sp. NBC_01480 TaxID=2903562 RepID=UPI002E2A7A62|nr:helix-turn-helix transcriptional regulator [Amycolatopsis sp. NBC_01480]